MSNTIVKNTDGTYSATIFTADNKRKLVMLPSAAERLGAQISSGAVFGYIAEEPQARALYQNHRLDNFHSNNIKDAAARVLEVKITEVEGNVQKIVAKLDLAGPKKNVLREMLAKKKIQLSLDLRALLNNQGKDKKRRYIQAVTGLYFTQAAA